MNTIDKVKKAIGTRNIKRLVAIKKQILRIEDYILRSEGKISTTDEIVSVKKFRKQGSNVFFGYYDLCQFDRKGEKLLAHIVTKHADPKSDNAEIVWIDPVTSEFHHISETGAWSWQQGSRLRWHPTVNDVVLFNDLANGRYILNQKNLMTGAIRSVSDAVYDIDCNFKYGISVNFERLQRLRPGYGYSRLGDSSKDISRPADDGVVRIELSTGRKDLLFSLEDLAKDVVDDGRHHYINHVCFSPSGEQFMFFHLWTASAHSPWSMRFYVCNTDGTKLRMLEDNVRISHYHWIDENNIIATRVVKGKNYSYVIYDVRNMHKHEINNHLLTVDGHPNLFRTGFVTDTYPQKDRMQYLYLSSFDGLDCREIAHLYSSPVNYGEHRCDLHPRVFNNKYITVDSTYKGNVRNIVLFETK